MHDPAIREILATLTRLWEEHTITIRAAMSTDHLIRNPLRALIAAEAGIGLNRIDAAMVEILASAPFPGPIRTILDRVLMTHTHAGAAHMIGRCIDGHIDEGDSNDTRILTSFLREGQR